MQMGNKLRCWENTSPRLLMFTDVVEKLLGCIEYTAQDGPHLGGGKSPLVVGVGKVSRLLSSELDSVAMAKAPQPTNSGLLSIPEEGRLSFHSPAPMGARISVGTSCYLSSL